MSSTDTETELDIPIPEAIKDNPEQVNKYLASMRAKRRQEADFEAEKLHAFKPVVREIERRENITIDPSRLSPDERNRLRQIAAEAAHQKPDDQGLVATWWDVASVDEHAERDWRKLIEKAAGAKVFKQRAEQAKEQTARKKMIDSARKALRRDRLRFVSKGSVQLPPQCFDRDALGLQSEWGFVDIGLLALIVGLIENWGGHDGARTVVDVVDAAEVHGDELHIDVEFFPGHHLTYGFESERLKIREVIDFLAENELLAVAKAGSVWRIKKGAAYLAEEDAAAFAAANHRQAS